NLSFQETGVLRKWPLKGLLSVSGSRLRRYRNHSSSTLDGAPHRDDSAYARRPVRRVPHDLRLVDATWYQFPPPPANWFVWVWYPSASAKLFTAAGYARSTVRTIAIRLACKRAIPYQKTRLFPQRELMNKRACAEKTSNSWTCSATSAPSSAFRRN